MPNPLFSFIHLVFLIIGKKKKAKPPLNLLTLFSFIFQTRQAFTLEQINEACYVDMNANKAVFDSLRNNPKVNYDGKRFSYKVTPNILHL